ncbi:MAG: transcription antitermination factor NusB [Candidatus Melainabacteria bacterium HGW-Melainabacteria-1]|nr:MAG: transcription antitermination factor NusB [Candidatus Melainabacteria bacterium HGW-Melainabacteria-1]
MSGDSAPRTLVYARHLGRELALLSLSSLSQYTDEISLEQISLAEVIERAVRMLSAEAEEYLSTAGKSLEESYIALDEFDPSEALEQAEASRDIQQFRRNVAREFDKIKERLQHQAQELSNAVNLLGEALHMPLLRTLSDNPHVRTFTLELVSTWRDQREHLDSLINQVSGEEWPLDRMNSIDRDLIRIAATEMLFDPIANRLHGDITPLPVIINEAVELAKKYGTPESYRFVNAVLRNLLPHAEERRRGKRP